jgi:hypothetical protein
VLLGNGDGTFRAAVNYDVGGPFSVAVGDFNADGLPDLAVPNYSGSSVTVLLHETWPAYFRDADGDGFGDPSVRVRACTAPPGYVANNTDCNDANAAVHPGADEVGNGVDDNCNGQIDEGLQPLAITSPNSTTFVLGAPNSFTVTTTGFPIPSITQTGSLPLGIGFSDHLDGTGILSGTPTTGGTFPITFTASNVAGTVTQSFTLTASGPLATLSPASIDWSEVYLWSLLPKTLTLANIGTSALTISKISLALGVNTDSNDFGYISFCDGTLAAGKSCLIFVSLWADEVGSKSATLSVTDNSPGSPQQASLTAKVINPVGWVSPVALTFGTIRVGSSSMKSVQLTNKGSTDLKVTGFGITGSTDFAQTNNCPASLAPGANCRIDVTFTPTAKTTRAGVLKITDNDRLGMQLVVLTGKGN